MDAKTFSTTVDFHGQIAKHDVVAFKADGVCSAFVSMRVALGAGEFVSRCSPDEARAIAEAILNAADFCDGVTVRHIPFIDKEVA